MTSILQLIIIFILSLIGVYVLFVCFKSEAKIGGGIEKKAKVDVPKNLISQIFGGIKRPKVQMSGAIAIFVIVFELLFSSYYIYSVDEIKKQCDLRVYEIEKKWKPEPWTISGEIIKEDSISLKGIEATYLPPSPHLWLRQASGGFDLYRVMICRAAKWPALQFSCDGYFPGNYEINSENAIIDENSKVIRLKKRISLERVKNEEGTK